MSEGIPCRVFPLSSTEDLAELQEQVREIGKWESAEDQSPGAELAFAGGDAGFCAPDLRS